MESLVGRKVRGFKFDTITTGVIYQNRLDKYIGQVGEIVSDNGGVFMVKFNDGSYLFYPASEIQHHLVDEWVVGEEYEFSDDDTWCKGKLLAIVNHRYKYISLTNNACGTPTSWKQIRHIQPQVTTKIVFLDKDNKRVSLTINGTVVELTESK